MAARNAETTDFDALFPVRTTIPGFAGTQVLTAFTGSAFTGTVGHSLTANTAGGVSSGRFVTPISEYNPDFVESILAADAAEPEARFDNVVDLLEWLDRD